MTPDTAVPLARTVLGDIEARELGIMLPHEHVQCDTRDVWGLRGDRSDRVTLENRDEVALDPLGFPDCIVLDDVDLAVAELRPFRALGGCAIADLTPEGIGRFPEQLVEASRLSGVHIIAGCGPYVERAHPAWVKDATDREVADRLIADITRGLDRTDVRAGIIGEIGTSEPVTEEERKVLRGAAIAQHETGLAITIHVHMGARTGHDILSVIENAGGDLTRVVLGHLDVHLSDSFEPETAVEHHFELARRGCVVEYDLCGFSEFVHLATGQSYRHPTDTQRLVAVLRMVEAGYADQVMLSHDVCKKIQLLRYGGVGYAHAIGQFRNQLAAQGLSDDVLATIYERNPQRVFGIDPSSTIFAAA